MVFLHQFLDHTERFLWERIFLELGETLKIKRKIFSAFTNLYLYSGFFHWYLVVYVKIWNLLSIIWITFFFIQSRFATRIDSRCSPFLSLPRIANVDSPIILDYLKTYFNHFCFSISFIILLSVASLTKVIYGVLLLSKTEGFFLLGLIQNLWNL